MSPVVSHDATLETEVLAAEDARIRALLDVDLSTLDALFDETLVHIHAPGLTHDKAQLLEHVSTRQAYLSIERGDLTVRLVGEVAIVTGSIRNRLRNPNGSERTVEGAVTQVLRRTADGRWLFLSFQMTPFGEQVWGALPSQQDGGAR